MNYDYDVIVIGGGAAGLVAATGAASLGAKTAMIEKSRLGGDCTWYGCVPSKTLLKSAQVANLAKRRSDFGITGHTDLELKGVMTHVREVVAKIAAHHPPEVFEARGITVLFGPPKFIDSHTINLAGKTLSAKRFIIATGSHPLVPPLDGLKEIDYLTNENVFDLVDLPRSIAVLGGGPIGVELSQGLSRLGVEVSIIEMMDTLLFREDKEAAAVLTGSLAKEGIKIYTGKKAVKFSQGSGHVEITLEDKNKSSLAVKAERVLVAVGRAPNIEGLDLEKAGVRFSREGIETDKTLRTTTRHIYACGDVVGPYQFSHMAEYQAIIAVGNALFPFKRRVDYSAVPWCTFTEPELAHLGLTEEEARKDRGDIKVYRSGFSANDRAVTDREEEGFAKVICDRRGRILGAHIVGSRAGELIHEYVLAKSAKLNIASVSCAIHIYPTLSQAVKRAADERLFEMLKSKWFSFLARFFVKRLK